MVLTRRLRGERCERGEIEEPFFAIFSGKTSQLWAIIKYPEKSELPETLPCVDRLPQIACGYFWAYPEFEARVDPTACALKN
jgi:hypothetical protein